MIYMRVLDLVLSLLQKAIELWLLIQDLPLPMLG